MLLNLYFFNKLVSKVRKNHVLNVSISRSCSLREGNLFIFSLRNICKSLVEARVFNLYISKYSQIKGKIVDAFVALALN